MSKQFVESLSDKDQVKSVFYVKDKNLLKDKKGNSYLSANVCDKTGAVNVRVFEKVGANNEHTVDVSQFFEDHTDKSDVKLLADALKNLKEETEYLRGEVREAEKTLNDKKDKLREFDQ